MLRHLRRLRARIRRTQIEGLGRSLEAGRGAKPGHPADIRSFVWIDRDVRRLASRPGDGHQIGTVSGDSDRLGRELHNVGQRRYAGLGGAATAEGLRVELTVASVDHGQNRGALCKDERWGRKCCQGGDPDRRPTGRERDSPGSRHANAQTGKASRPDRDGDPVEIRERDPGVVHDLVNGGKQRLGMAAAHRHRHARQDSMPGIEHGG